MKQKKFIKISSLEEFLFYTKKGSLFIFDTGVKNKTTYIVLGNFKKCGDLLSLKLFVCGNGRNPKIMIGFISSDNVKFCRILKN